MQARLPNTLQAKQGRVCVCTCAINRGRGSSSYLLVRRRLRQWHLNTVCGSATVSHVCQASKVRVAILIGQTGGAT